MSTAESASADPSAKQTTQQLVYFTREEEGDRGN